MAVNNRITFASQAVGLKPNGNQDPITVVHGVQSVGTTTSFNLEQFFELGQAQVYETVEGLPEVQMTMEKVLDGYPLIYHLATSDSTVTGLLGRSKQRCCASIGIYPDENDVVSGVAPAEGYASGLYFSDLTYTFSTDGPCTESVSFEGNNMEWFTADSPNPVGFNDALDVELDYDIDTDTFTGQDEPLALDNNGQFLGGIQQRENVRIDLSILPQSIQGVAQNANAGNAYTGVYGSGGTPLVHIQNCTISTSTGREDIPELGRRTPYYKSASSQIEVTTDFEVISISGNFVDVYEEGDPAFNGTKNQGNNTKSETILIRMNDGTAFDLGTKNKLQTATYGGGDATGGNATSNYTYLTFNDLTVLHPEDPAFSTYSAAQSGLTVTS